MHEFASLNPGKYQCIYFNAYVLSKFIFDITDIGEGKHRKETWAYNQYKSEIGNRQPILSKRGDQCSCLFCMRRGLSPAVGQ